MKQKESSMTAPAALTAEVVRHALRQVKDPELDMNIIDLASCTTSRSWAAKWRST